MKNWQEEYETLQKKFEQYKIESIKWSVDDFMYYPLEGYTISLERSQEALEDMIRHHDAEDGITWNTIEQYLRVYGTKTKTN